MADQSFDAIIVGGGNKALILAMYLTKYGKMEVGIFEERHELGGGWSSEEPAPGFIGDTCSTSHVGNYHIPVYKDFPEWELYGARYRHSDVTLGVIYQEDDSCVVQYSAFEDVDPTQERTAKEFARFSQRDAQTWLRLWEKYCKYWKPAFDEWMFTPAKPLDVPDALEMMVRNPEAGVDPLWLFQTPLQVFGELFESVELKLAFSRVIQSLGWQNDMVGAGFSALTFLFYWSHQQQVVGGTHCLTHASHKVIVENGGKVFTNMKVDKVLIENGKAKGVKLADGTEIEARKAVITDVDPDQLCFHLVGKEHLDQRILSRVANLSRDWICITWYSWALKERFHLKAENFNPDVWKAMVLTLADKDPGTFVRESCERKLHQWPSKLNLNVVIYLDPLRTPGEGFTMLTEEFVVPAFSLTDEQWKQQQQIHAEKVVKKIGEFAPDMSWDKVIGYIPVTPLFTARMARNFRPAGNWCIIDHVPSQMGKFRPIPEFARHKIPGIDDLYCTGSAWHPFGAAHSAQGYNCYKVMAEDLGLESPWQSEGRLF